MSTDIDRLTALLQESGLNAGNRLFGARRLFEDVALDGKVVLDIGCGQGWLALFAACSGAAHVVGIEPEADGSKPGAGATFERNIAALALTNVELAPTTFQEFDHPGPFDVIVSHASINHLNEDACIRLRQDADARAEYRHIMTKLARLSTEGTIVFICDCDYRNFFQRIHVRNPLAPTIEWHKHQSPDVWVELLQEAGFTEPHVRWASLNTLRRPGALMFGNRPASYFFTSAFMLSMRYSSAGA